MSRSPSSTPYRIGLLFSRHKFGVVAAGFAAIAAFIAINNDKPGEAAPGKAPIEMAKFKPADQLDTYCGPELQDAVKRAKEAFAKKDYATANGALDPCHSRIPKESEAYAFYLKANAAFIKDIEAKKVADAKAEKARKKKEGVKIGMSQQDVLDSSWGKPSHVNRTTNAYGTREQWVYPGGYLYFDDGVLTSVQN